MALNKRVQFYYRTQAIACGHVPCRYCLPPRWTVVRGRLLTPVKPASPIGPVGPVDSGGPGEPEKPVESEEGKLLPAFPADPP